MNLNSRSSFLAAALALVGIGCGARQDAVARGRDLFAAPAFARAPPVERSCATCHATSQAGDARRLPGYDMAGVSSRPAYWGGGFADLLDAIDFCAASYLGGAAIDPASDDARALHAYLGSLAGPAIARPLTVVDNLDAAYDASLAGGDAGNGGSLYALACAGCHGAIHTGGGRLEPLAPRLPDDTRAAHGADPITGARPITVEKIRHGSFLLAGGTMPLYSREALADREVADLLAYLGY